MKIKTPIFLRFLINAYRRYPSENPEIATVAAKKARSLVNIDEYNLVSKNSNKKFEKVTQNIMLKICIRSSFFESM
ncbi:MAG: hypothetical protein WBA54_14630 [Acidaminobacteraceae bacterium]